MNTNEITQIMQAIADVSKKVNSINANLNSDTIAKDTENKSNIVDSQEALIELGLELDSRIADIENALCELTEEGN